MTAMEGRVGAWLQVGVRGEREERGERKRERERVGERVISVHKHRTENSQSTQGVYKPLVLLKNKFLMLIMYIDRNDHKKWCHLLFIHEVLNGEVDRIGHIDDPQHSGGVDGP